MGRPAERKESRLRRGGKIYIGFSGTAPIPHHLPSDSEPPAVLSPVFFLAHSPLQVSAAIGRGAFSVACGDYTLRQVAETIAKHTESNAAQ